MTYAFFILSVMTKMCYFAIFVKMFLGVYPDFRRMIYYVFVTKKLRHDEMSMFIYKSNIINDKC